jgi:integrase
MRTAGTYADGQGLYLVVGEAKQGPELQAKSWFFRYVSNGRVREMGLGSAHDVPLAKARELAAALRSQRKSGVDPAEARIAERKKGAADRAKGLTFAECAEKYIESSKAGWKNKKHAAQWTSTLEAYAYPHFGSVPVADVDVERVLKALKPIWSDKAETAGRVRGRIESVLSYASANGFRKGANPATWRGHLDKILPPKSRVAAVTHHAALPYSELPAFIHRLHAAPGIGAMALEFAILTTARTGEVIGATWGEIDLGGAMWTIPAERMKARREHRVPLCDRALAILGDMAKLGTEGFVFKGSRPGKGLSNMSLDAVLRRMSIEVTVHGFRSTFRDWAADQTAFPREVAEACLAHTLKDKTEAAYRRSDLFEKRRELISAFAEFSGVN